MPQLTNSRPARHKQYGLLWGWVLEDITAYFGLPPHAKRLVYDAFKHYLGYESMAGTSSIVMHRFVFEVVGTMAMEFGYYVAMPDEPENADGISLEELWTEYKRKSQTNQKHEKVSHLQGDVQDKHPRYQTNNGDITPFRGDGHVSFLHGK